MSPEAAILLGRLAKEEDSLVIRRLRSLLETPDAIVDKISEHRTKAGDIEPTWRVRQQVAKMRRKRFLGISSLVSALQASSPTRQIEMGHVRDETHSAVLFFDAETKAFVGAVIVKMSAHTLAYYRGELTGDPSAARPSLRKTAKAESHRSLVAKKAMA